MLKYKEYLQIHPSEYNKLYKLMFFKKNLKTLTGGLEHNIIWIMKFTYKLI